MRWPFRRRDTGFAAEPQGPVAPTSGAAPVAPSAAEPVTPAGPIVRPVAEWVGLPAIGTVISPRSTLITGPPPVQAPLPGVRSTSVPADVAPDPGRVVGLAKVLPVPEPVVLETPLPVPPPAPLPPRPVRTAAPEPTPALTEAVGDFVGEAREPAEPYRAPGWMRYVPTWLTQSDGGGVPALDAISGPPVIPSNIPSVPPVVPSIPSFLQRLPVTDTSTTELVNERPEPMLPPRVAETVRVERQEPPQVLTPRRPSLGQARRLGLGAPLSRPADEPFRPEPLMLAPAPVAEQTVVEASREPAPLPEPPTPTAQADPDPEPPIQPADRTPDPTPVVDGPVPARPRPERPLPVVTASVRPARNTTEADRFTPRPAPRVRAVAVPRDVADVVRRTHGSDVADVPVYRGPRVDDEARVRGARAFTRSGAVFLPDTAGPIGSTASRALLAHELTHVVQQRTLGGALPPLSSPEGQRLEQEALDAESGFASGPSMGTQELVHAPGNSGHGGHDHEPTGGPEQLAATVASAPTHADTSSSSSGQPPFDHRAQQEISRIAETSTQRVLEEWHNPHLQQQRQQQQGNRGSGTPPVVGGSMGDEVSFVQRVGNPSGGATSTGTGGGGGGGTFNREARREELIQETIDRINAEKDETGEPRIDHLGQDQLDRIERTLDREEASGGGGGSGGGRTGGRGVPRPPIVGGSMGDEVSFVQRVGDPSTGGVGGSASTRPAVTGGSMGDEVSFSERRDNQIDTATGQPLAAAATGETGDRHAAASVGHPTAGPRHPTGTQDPDPHEHELDLDRINLDDLTTRIYDRLRSRLRLELLVDRERSGQLSDFR